MIAFLCTLQNVITYHCLSDSDCPRKRKVAGALIQSDERHHHAQVTGGPRSGHAWTAGSCGTQSGVIRSNIWENNGAGEAIRTPSHFEANSPRLAWPRWRRSRKVPGTGNIQPSRSVTIWRMMYTTNSVEALNSKLRRAVRTRGHFPGDEAAVNLLYLALNQRAAEWKKSPHE